MDNQQAKTAALSFLIGVIVAVLLFPKREYETVYKTEIKTETDTLFVSSTDTIYVPKNKIKTEVLRDTLAETK